MLATKKERMVDMTLNTSKIDGATPIQAGVPLELNTQTGENADTVRVPVGGGGGQFWR